jgi:hypothetical protein
MPTVDEILAKLGGAKLFSKLHGCVKWILIGK